MKINKKQLIILCLMVIFIAWFIQDIINPTDEYFYRWSKYYILKTLIVGLLAIYLLRDKKK